MKRFEYFRGGIMANDPDGGCCLYLKEPFRWASDSANAEGFGLPDDALSRLRAHIERRRVNQAAAAPAHRDCFEVPYVVRLGPAGEVAIDEVVGYTWDEILATLSEAV